MATIRIDPTWVATVTTTGEYPDYEYEYNYDYPIEHGGDLWEDGWSKSAFIGFDMEIIRNILTTTFVSRKTLIVKLSAGVNLNWIELVLHQSENPPSDSNEIFPESTAVSADMEIVGDLVKINLDTSLAIAGPTGPIHVDFLEAINLGYKGFTFYLFPNDFLSADEVYIELEGNFDNPRPTPVAPVGGEVRNVAEIIRFEWRHNSPFRQKSFELSYRLVTNPSWTTINQESSNQFYELPANTLTSGTYEWRVRTTSEFDFISPWTLTSVFTVAYTSQSPVVIQPTPNQVMPTQDLTVEWEAIPNQWEYEIRLFEMPGNILVRQRQEISSDNLVTLKGWLENGKSYSLQVRIREENQLWSSWVTIPITVQYTAPAKPILHFVEDKELSAVKIFIENPSPVGTEPVVVLQDLYRREPGGDWIKIAENLPNNAQFIDYTPVGDTVEYRVNAIGNNLVRVDSDIFTNTLEIGYPILQLANNPVEYVRLTKVRQRSVEKNYNATQKKFVGRKRPVTEFGDTQENNLSLEFLIYPSDYEKLIEMLEKQETLLYRDVRKRKLFVTTGSASITDEFLDRYSVSMTLNEVDYKEGVSDD